MDFNINKREETDNSIIFNVTMPESEYQKEKYALYLENRYIDVDIEKLRPGYSEVELRYLDYTGQSRLGQAVYKKHQEEISKAIAEELGIEAEDAIIYLSHLFEFGPESYAEFTYLKKEPLDLEDVVDYLPLASIDESQIPDVEQEVIQEINTLKNQNIRLIPAEKPLDVNSTVSITLLKTEDGETEEVLTANANFIELVLMYGADIDHEKEYVQDDTIGVADYAIKRYENLYGPGEYAFKINQVYDTEYPELDDDFAAEVSEYDTMEELTEGLRKEKRDYYYHNLEGERFNTVFEDFMRDQDGIDETFKDLVATHELPITSMISYQSTLLDNPLVTPLGTDEIILAAIALKDHYLGEFSKKILESEIGETANLDEEQSRIELERDLIRRNAENQVSGVNIQEEVESILPLYMAQRAVNEYIKAQEVE